jgi:hypothetical protein
MKLPFALLTSALLYSSLAHADAAASASAEMLFKEGKALADKKDFVAACPKFAASQRLDPGAGTLLHLGNCYENTGKFASAWATFTEAAAAARAKGRQDWADNASKRAERLEPKLSRLSVNVNVAAKPAGLEVVRDGVVLDAGAFGTKLPVDAGAHVLEARAAGFKPWTQTITLKEAQVLVVDVPALEKVPEAAAVAPAIVTTTPPPASDKPSTAGGSGVRTAGYVVTGVGILGLAAGGVTGLMAMQSNNRSKELCPELRCANQQGVDAAQSARTFGTVSTIAFIGGGVLTAAGLGMVLAGGGKSKPESGISLRLTTVPMPGGAAGIFMGEFQ